VTIVHGLARVGRYAEALELARTVGPTRDLDFGGTRATAIGSVADSLARARRADEARAAAAEADKVGVEAFASAASLTPFMPPEGFEKAHRDRVERLLADGGDAPAARTAATSVDAWGGELDPLDEFLVELANDAGEREPREALLSLKEATRIAGWTSHTWRKVSEVIRVRT
jgi:hypothetical protein